MGNVVSDTYKGLKGKVELSDSKVAEHNKKKTPKDSYKALQQCWERGMSEGQNGVLKWALNNVAAISKMDDQEAGDRLQELISGLTETIDADEDTTRDAMNTFPAKDDLSAYMASAQVGSHSARKYVRTLCSAMLMDLADFNGF